MKNFKIINKCLLCSGNIKIILDMGSTPLANDFLNSKINQNTFPLRLVQCSLCNHVQIDCIVDKDILYKNYLYVSGTSASNKKHFEDYARDVMRNYLELYTFDDGDKLFWHDDSIQKFDNQIVIDIGSNDGTLLESFKKYGCNVLGIEPAENIAKIANDKGINTICKFFNKQTALEIKNELGSKKVKIITCNNMFAHNEDLKTILEGIDILLDKDGSIIFENSYLLDILDGGLIDLIYHEHIHHHHIAALQKFFKNFNMEIYHIEHLNNHGGSVRVYVCRSFMVSIGGKPIHKSVNDYIEKEKNISENIVKFQNKINIIALKNKLNEKLDNIKKDNKSIVIYGFPAKATTLLYSLNVDEKIIDFAVDDNPLKQNKFSPGKHIPILHPDEVYKRNPDYLLILAWNFADSIIENCKKNGYKGKFIIPLPELREVE